MQSNYSEQDTEYTRHAERSSAGAETHNLAAPAGVYTSYAPVGQAAVSNQRNLLGMGLIALGAVMFMFQLFPGRDELIGGAILLTIASCFLFFSFWKHVYALLIPGSILAGLSIGVTFADVTNGASVLWGLALGFMAILFLGRSLFAQRNNWPIYPAIPLFAAGVIVAVASLPTFMLGGLIWLPLLLIGAGLYLGWGRRTA